MNTFEKVLVEPREPPCKILFEASVMIKGSDGNGNAFINFAIAVTLLSPSFGWNRSSK